MKRVLVIKPSSLGDIVHALQVVACWRAYEPDMELTWVVRPLFAPIVEASGLVQHVILFHREQGWRGWWRTLREIRQHHYDVVLDMQGLLRSALWACGSRASRRIGRADGREGANLLLREKVSMPAAGKKAHALEVLLQYLPLLQVQVVPRELTPLVFSGLPQVRSCDGPVWAVFPESRRAEKEWPFLLQACEQWLERLPSLTIVALAGKPRVVPDSLAGHPRWHDCMGKTSLPEMIAWIQQADGIVVNDSGPMHIAAALGKPLLTLFGATSPERFGPYPMSNPRFLVLQSKSERMDELPLDSVVEAGLRHLPR